MEPRLGGGEEEMRIEEGVESELDLSMDDGGLIT